MALIKEILGFQDIVCGWACLTYYSDKHTMLYIREGYTKEEFDDFFNSLFQAIEQRELNRTSLEEIDWLISDEELEELNYLDEIASTIWSKHGWATLEELDHMGEPCWIINIQPEIPAELRR
jgi:N-acetylneuraminic acid mutarotase